MKVCTKCKEEKHFSEYYKDKRTANGYRAYCKICHSVDMAKHYAFNTQKYAEYYRQNITQIKETKQKHYKKNKEHINKTNQLYYHKNKSKSIRSMLKWEQAKLKNDPMYKLSHNLRARFSVAIKKQYKTGSAVRDLGMPIPAFLVYLNLGCIDQYGIPYTGNESKFHLDHITPLSFFDLTDRNQLLAAVNWRNIQVLSAKDNLSKGAKIL